VKCGGYNFLEVLEKTSENFSPAAGLRTELWSRSPKDKKGLQTTLVQKNTNDVKVKELL
jgi:hypothetical protein